MANYTIVDGARVGVLMGSASDWPTMKKTSDTLASFGVAHECNALSAHRNADLVRQYLAEADKRGVELFICAAGGAAHLAGVVAAHTEKPDWYGNRIPWHSAARSNGAWNPHW